MLPRDISQKTAAKPLYQASYGCTYGWQVQVCPLQTIGLYVSIKLTDDSKATLKKTYFFEQEQNFLRYFK